MMGKTRSCRRRAGAKAGRSALLPVLAAVLLGFAACNPVETWRDWSGAAKNDPNPATTPNSKNLAAGEASGYPNLATVPPPPSRAMTSAERDKLVQNLIADRANAKYTDEKLRAGFAEVSAPVPPPPPPPLPAPTTAPAAEPNSGQAQVATAAAPPPPAKPGAAPTAPAGSAPAASPGAAPPTSASTALPGSGRTAGAAPVAAPKGPRKAGEPPEPGPMESSLQAPQIPVALPAPQQVEPAPPPPRQMTMRVAPPTANTAAAAAHLPPPPAPAAMPAAIASAQFEPPPPQPVLAPPAPTHTAAATGPGKSGTSGKSGSPGKTGAGTPASAAAMPVALINFPADSTTLSESDRQALGRIVPLYRHHPGRVRIVGYAGVGSGAVEQLNGYRAALDRAQAVAAALARAGIPADKILVEAAPMGADSGQSRAEVLLEQ